jgi:hypothetical protein
MSAPYRFISAIHRPDRPNPPRPPGDGPRREPRFYVGVDLGQAHDPTALAIVERVQPDSRRRPAGPPDYHVRHLERVALKTPYPLIVERIGALMQTPALAGESVLLIDGAGVGRGVLDLMNRDGLKPIAVTATGGKRVTGGGPLRINVPKQDLVTNLQILFQAQRLKIAAVLPHAPALLQELQTFRVRTTAAGHAQFGAMREGERDDLTFALALACWYAERRRRRPAQLPSDDTTPPTAEPRPARPRMGNGELISRLETLPELPD